MLSSGESRHFPLHMLNPGLIAGCVKSPWAQAGAKDLQRPVQEEFGTTSLDKKLESIPQAQRICSWVPNHLHNEMEQVADDFDVAVETSHMHIVGDIPR